MTLRFIIYTFTVLCFISNLYVFNSYVDQSSLLLDAVNDDYLLSINNYQNINSKYPSLALNSVPIMTYLSRYDTHKKDYKKAIKKLSLSLEKNPYSTYTKYLIARNYIFLNDLNSSQSILEEVFNDSPKIESSSALYFAVLGENKNISKLIYHFNDMKLIENKNLWNYYISSVKNSIQIKSDSMFYSDALKYYNTLFK